MAIESYKNAGFMATIFGPVEATGTIVSINFRDSETLVGVDLNGDGKADIYAFTNSFLGGDIMKKCSEWSDGKSDGCFTQINPFTTLKAKVIKATFANGSLSERMIPRYLLFRYGKESKDLVAQN